MFLWCDLCNSTNTSQDIYLGALQMEYNVQDFYEVNEISPVSFNVWTFLKLKPLDILMDVLIRHSPI